MTEEAEEFKNMHQRIYLNYYKAKIHLEIWWLCHNKNYINSVNCYKEYFNPSAEAHLGIGVMNIMKIFDTYKDSANINKLLNYTQTHTKKIELSFPECKFPKKEIQKEMRGEVVKLEPYLKKIKQWRDKKIAHEELKFTTVPPIKWKCFEKIFNFLESYILDYGSEPNHIFVKPDETTKKIEKFFDEHFTKSSTIL